MKENSCQTVLRVLNKIIFVLIVSFCLASCTNYSEPSSRRTCEGDSLTGFNNSLSPLSSVNTFDQSGDRNCSFLNSNFDYSFWELPVDKDPIPFYYKTNNYLDAKMNCIMKNSFVETGITFSFITDLHLLDNSKSSKEIMKKVLDIGFVPFAICGGDIPSAFASGAGCAEVDCYAQIKEWNSWVMHWGEDRVYQLRGNHDYVVNEIGNDDYFRISEAGTYKQIMTFIENKVNVGNPHSEYYYFDILSQKMRFIIIDAHVYTDVSPNVVANYFNQNQINWLLNVLDNSNGLDTIIVSHEPCNKNMSGYSDNMSVLHSVAESFKNKGVFSGIYSGVSWNHDFSNSTGDLICILSGHSHQDESSLLNNVLSISTTCDAMYDEDNLARVRGTISEIAFDVFSIDTTNRTIVTTRIGAGNDRIWNY